MDSGGFIYLRAMKWILGCICATMLLTACDNDLVVVDEWKDIPVVWALLNKSDTAHYIRLEKAFLDPTTSALDIARIPDSLYYDDATVTLKRISGGQTYELERVNGDLEGYPREGGIFAETPNYLYKIKANEINLQVGEEYQLIIDREDGTPLVTAKTEIVPKPVLRNPSAAASLAFKPKSSFPFIWNSLDEAATYDLKLRFHYREKSPETGNQFESRTVEWAIVKNWPDVEFRIDGVEFFNFVKSSVPQNTQATRIFESIEIVLWAGGKELAEFIKIVQANQNITSTQDVPAYTNLSEGIGIFSSRNVSYNTDFMLTAATLDSLRDGSITGHLNFQ